MTPDQRNYYLDMVERNRGYMVFEDKQLVGVVTYLIGSDDDKYMFEREPWVVIEDAPKGHTVYIDQLVSKDTKNVNLRREFTKLLRKIKGEFPNVTQVKWMRAPALFRKKGVRHETGTQTEIIVHRKDIK